MPKRTAAERLTDHANEEREKVDRVLKNVQLLEAAGALEAFVYGFCDRETDRAYEKLANVVFFDTAAVCISFVGEFSGGHFYFDPTKRPLAWRCIEEPGTLIGVRGR